MPDGVMPDPEQPRIPDSPVVSIVRSDSRGLSEPDWNAASIDRIEETLQPPWREERITFLVVHLVRALCPEKVSDMISLIRGVEIWTR